MELALPTSDSLPRWDSSNVYSGLEAADYRAAFARLDHLLAELERHFDQHQIRRLAELPPAADKAVLAELLADVIGGISAVNRLAETLNSYAYAFYSTDSYDAVAAREVSQSSWFPSAGSSSTCGCRVGSVVSAAGSTSGPATTGCWGSIISICTTPPAAANTSCPRSSSTWLPSSGRCRRGVRQVTGDRHQPTQGFV